MTSKDTTGRANGGSFEISEREARNRAESVAAFDRHLLDGARRALAAIGCGALEFLAANPTLSGVELAKRLNRGASAIGLVMVVYGEAVQKGLVREVAKDMLIREICDAFPHGWPNLFLVHPHVSIGSWRSGLTRNVTDPRVEEYSLKIIRELAIENHPPDGWKPKHENDPLIDDLFDRFWPVEPK